jgi:hypothetical protein
VLARFRFSFFAVGNWLVERDTSSELDQRLLLRLRSTKLRIARFPRARRIRGSSLCSWVFPNIVQGILKYRKLDVEHSGLERPHSRAISNENAGLLHKLCEQRIF